MLRLYAAVATFMYEIIHEKKINLNFRVIKNLHLKRTFHQAKASNYSSSNSSNIFETVKNDFKILFSMPV